MSRYYEESEIMKALDSNLVGTYNGLVLNVNMDEFLDGVPTADVVEVKHGRWIKDRLCSTSGGTYGVRRCSVCEDYFQDIGYGWNYCPNCGAKMLN